MSGVDPLASRIPVTVLTGFLGSGKTTLLRRLLRDPGMNRAAVIINEFGEVGLDHELVQASSEQTTLLSNGCLCCTVRTDLQDAMRELFVKRRNGEVIDFDRVFVETTGLADPGPVVHSLQRDGLLGAQYRLNGVVTLIDAVNGLATLERQPEAVKQAAMADRLIITKGDIAAPGAEQALRERLAAMNPYAAVSSAVDGALDPELLRNIMPANVAELSRNPDGWLSAGAPLEERSPYLGSRVAKRPAHDPAIESYCLWFDQPFKWEALIETLQLLSTLRGPDLLRVKGIVNVAGESGPVVIHGVQHVFHPPLRLERWHGEERRSRIVFIARRIPRASVEALFSAVRSL